MSFKDAAFEVLLEARKPLHYVELTRLVLEKGLVETGGKTPERTLNTDISKEINMLKGKSRFVRVKKGVYGINPDILEGVNTKHTNPRQTATPVRINDNFQNPDDSETNKNTSNYIGKAGEYAVASELLFRDYNISMMSVDEGIDIIASKNDNTYNIQVKTSHENQFKRYVSDIRISSFERHNTSNTFYIFVLKSEEYGASYLIFPYHRIKEFVDRRIISGVNSNTKYRVNIFVKEDSFYLGNQGNDVSYFYNNWELVT